MPPNLLYIHSDQHTPYVTGCYGDPVVQTPNIDRIAARGVLFENVYCPSPICVPSRMSTLTGLYPHQSGVWTNTHVLDSGTPTLAHSMGAGGYRPILVGRMHSNGPDQLHGYAERLVGDHGPNYPGGGPPVDRGVLTATAGPDKVSLVRSGSGQSGYQVHDQYVTQAAVDWLRREATRRETEGAEKPFSLSVGYMLPHPPYVAKKSDYQLYENTLGLPHHPQPDTSLHPFHEWWRRETGVAEVTEQEVLRSRASYWALVTALDRMIGQVVGALEDCGLADNTLIIYTSDHGDMVGEHGLFWKHVFYEESVKVPLVMSWPAVIPQGLTDRHVVSSLDTTATMLDALDCPRLPDSPGRSLLPLISRTGPWEDVAFSEYCSDEYAPDGGCYQRMIRSGRWKLIYYHEQPAQLFDLETDPHERNDLGTNSSHKGIRDELIGRVLGDWDPESIRTQMTYLAKRSRILADWAHRVQPPNSHRWHLKSEMNRLD